MNHSSPDDRDRDGSWDLIGFLSGDWIPQSELAIPVDDLGFRQGVIAVERLRTYWQRPFALELHLKRWEQSTRSLEIDGLPAVVDTEKLIGELLNRNSAIFASELDVGITMFATPGKFAGDQPTLGLHLNRLNHELNQRRRDRGQPLVLTNVRQPDPQSWPRSAKVRSRIHYYRADTTARIEQQDGLGILIDDDGSVTETSIANLALAIGGVLVSPPIDRVLGGITQSVIETIARGRSIPWKHRPIPTSLLREADEILLMGTDTGIWYANSIDGHPIHDGMPGCLYQQLREGFDELIQSLEFRSIV